MEYMPFFRGILVAGFLACVMDFDIRNIKTWGAVITLNILVAI